MSGNTLNITILWVCAILAYAAIAVMLIWGLICRFDAVFTTLMRWFTPNKRNAETATPPETEQKP